VRLTGGAHVSTSSYQFKIDGDNISPQTVPLPKLLGVLGDFYKAINATSPETEDENVCDVSLTNITTNSCDVELTLSEASFKGVEKITSSIQRDDISELPKVAQEALNSIWKYAKNNHWVIGLNNLQTNQGVKILPDSKLFIDYHVFGVTSVVGVLDRIGGSDNPTCKIKTKNEGEFTAKIKTKKLAEQISPRLFKTIAVEGEATWDIRDWKVTAFTITKLLDFEDVGPKQAFENIAKAAGDVWDGVDADDYVSDLRKG